MRDSPALPISALVTAAALTAVLGMGRLVRANLAAPLSELEIGLAAWAFVFGLFGGQGLISILLEGGELRPGFSAPRGCSRGPSLCWPRCCWRLNPGWVA